MRDSSLFVQLVQENISKLVLAPKLEKEVNAYMENHGVSNSEMQKLYNNIERLSEVDLRLVALIGEQLHIKLNIEDLKLENWFNELEIKEIKAFYHLQEEREEIKLPYTFTNVIKDGDCYVFPISVKLIANLYDFGLLNYNYDIQRQASYQKIQNKIIRKPYINKASVKDIVKHLNDGTLIKTGIVFNAHLGSSISSEELIYNAKESTLTVTEGTRLDIVDGMHRITASFEAWRMNKDIDFNFICIMLNGTTKQAQNYQAQQAKANPIPKSRIQELEATRYSDVVVQQLRLDSELKGKISSRDNLGKGTGELVSYGVLANAIDSSFEMNSKIEAIEVSKYLSDYFMYLFGYHQEEYSQLEQGNLLFYNKFFVGHIELAKLMKENNVSLDKLKIFLKGVDFNKSNDLFQRYNIIVEGRLGTKVEKPIKKLFSDIFNESREKIT